MWIATAERSREIDRRAIHDFHIPSETLMVRAAGAVYAVVHEMCQPPAKLVVCCGKGNNGGDGFALAKIARHFGFAVTCYCIAKGQSELSADSQTQYAAAVAEGVQIEFEGSAGWRQLDEQLAEATVIVDALLGTGTTGAPRGEIAHVIEAINLAARPVVAVDLPSGIDANTGHAAGKYVRATRTLTFGLPKPFLFQSVGQIACGEWSVDDIGFPKELLDEPTNMLLVDQRWVRQRIHARSKTAHKGSSGSLLLVSGSNRYRGAAHMAARAALRSGAGLVFLSAPEPVCTAIAASLPEAILLPTNEVPFKKLLQESATYDAAVFGPGLSTDIAVMNTLRGLWAKWEIPCVIDADALNGISTGLVPPPADCVFTPHPGEMARLLGKSVVEIQQDRFGAAREASDKFNRTVLLKGANTIVASPGHPLTVNSTGNAGMATGGMGDVLSGVIGTLLAQGRSSFEAAVLGAYWHGLAADICSSTVGEFGYLATEVADALPDARCRMTTT